MFKTLLKWIAISSLLMLLSFIIMLAIGQVQLYFLTSVDSFENIEIGFPYWYYWFSRDGHNFHGSNFNNLIIDYCLTLQAVIVLFVGFRLLKRRRLNRNTKSSTTTFILLFIVVAFSSCNMNSNTEHEKYESMHFVRDGGGQIDFSVFETTDENQLKVVVSKYAFRDTTIELLITKNAYNTGAFSSFHSAINKETLLIGNLKQSTMATGTWVHIYFRFKGKEKEVTNEVLRTSLLKFEDETLSLIK